MIDASHIDHIDAPNADSTCIDTPNIDAPNADSTCIDAPNIDALFKDAVALLREVVATPSPSFEEEAVSNLICGRLESWGLTPERIKNNIICRQSCHNPSKPSLMLCAHIDTVQPSPEYDFNPYIPDQESMPDAICGLGSNDDGGSLAAITAAFRHFKDSELPFNLLLVLSAEEERSGPNGMRYLWGNVLEDNVKWAIVGEPTGMKAATSERGLLVLDACAHGKSGHAARNEGVNAIYIAMEDIRKLLEHKFERISPSMGEVKLSVTQISAGSAHNVVPDLCDFVVDIRPTEQYSNKEILDELQNECRSELRPRNLANRSSATPSVSPLLTCVKDLGIETFSSPTTSDWMRISCEAIKMGPGDSARSHRKNEYLLYTELRQAIETYIQFIQHYADIME